MLCCSNHEGHSVTHSSVVAFQKRPFPSDPTSCQTPKKQRLFEQCSSLLLPSHGDSSSNGVNSAPTQGNSNVQIKTEPDKTGNPLEGSLNGLHSLHRLTVTPAAPKPDRKEPAPGAPSPKPPHTNSSICTNPQFNNGQHKKKKSKKHKDKERERLKPEWIETSPDQKQENLKGTFKKIKSLKGTVCEREVTSYSCQLQLYSSSFTQYLITLHHSLSCLVEHLFLFHFLLVSDKQNRSKQTVFCIPKSLTLKYCTCKPTPYP